MELRQLRYFMTVAELKSFSRASAVAHIAQPALSRQIRKLEDELGVALFDRDGRGVTLNHVGQQFYARVSAIMRDIAAAKADVQSSCDVPLGEVTLAIPQQLGSRFIADLVTNFRAKFPRASLKIVDGWNSQIYEWLEFGRVDVGVVCDPKDRQDLWPQRVFLEDFYLVGACGQHLVSGPECPFDRLESIPLIMPDRPSRLRDRVDAEAVKRGVSIKVEVGLDSIGAIKELVRSGHGYSIMSLPAVSREIARGELAAARIVHPSISWPVMIAISPKARLSLLSKKLIELLSAELEGHMRVGCQSDVDPLSVRIPSLAASALVKQRANVRSGA